MIKYLLHPGYVISKTDGDRHYITAKMLVKLYNVRKGDVLSWVETMFEKEKEV